MNSYEKRKLMVGAFFVSSFSVFILSIVLFAEAIGFRDKIIGQEGGLALGVCAVLFAVGWSVRESRWN